MPRYCCASTKCRASPENVRHDTLFFPENNNGVGVLLSWRWADKQKKKHPSVVLPFPPPPPEKKHPTIPLYIWWLLCSCWCAGDEMGMLEDMAASIRDLQGVTFKLTPSQTDDLDIKPTVSGCRWVRMPQYGKTETQTLTETIFCVFLPFVSPQKKEKEKEDR